MAGPALLFGIGATKAGTSWLHGYLSAHPECNLRSIKELHFFDTLEFGGRKGQLQDLARKEKALVARLSEAGAEDADGSKARELAEIRLYARVLRKGDERVYLDYLFENAGEDRLVGDITPAYALLPESRLARMATMAAEVRFVYLMRDPVERLWSHVRMIARRRSKTGQDIARRAGRILDRTLAGGEAHITDRGDYREVLGKLAAAVDPRQLFTGIYEELFSDAALARLCAFLGISARPGDYGTRVHAGVPVAMTAEQRRRAADYLRPQYDYVATRLGALPAAWEASRAGF